MTNGITETGWFDSIGGPAPNPAMNQTGSTPEFAAGIGATASAGYRNVRQQEAVMTEREHHVFCLDVLARCYEHVHGELRAAILQGVEGGIELGFPVHIPEYWRNGKKAIFEFDDRSVLRCWKCKTPMEFRLNERESFCPRCGTRNLLTI